MQLLSRLLACLAILLLAVSAKPDYSAQARAVRSAGKRLSGNGRYSIRNLATGQSLAFQRDRLVNFIPAGGSQAVEIQVQGNQLRLSGLTKCASAQWSHDGGYDHAAVSYACSVGKNPTGTKTLEKPKQWWFAVPAGGRDQYYLITMDHLHDMPARAMSSGRKNTVGGYFSTALEVWNRRDRDQIWTITKR